MKKRKLGELEVSSVGFGCMGLSHAYGSAVPKDEAIKIIRDAYQAGYMYFDTAECYLGTFAEGDFRNSMPQYSDQGYEDSLELLTYLRDLANQKQATPAQISMAWMICKKPYIMPIPGTRKKERLIENAKAADVVLTTEEVKNIDGRLDRIKMSNVFGGHRG